MITLRAYVVTAVLAVGAALVCLPAQAQANSQASSTESSSKAKKPKKEKKAKGTQAAKGGSVTFHEGSGETRSERERRLTRECKGRPNSGLCEGFARP
jgi:lipopolysaccharide export LptBFGC system permease protein LptF